MHRSVAVAVAAAAVAAGCGGETAVRATADVEKCLEQRRVALQSLPPRAITGKPFPVKLERAASFGFPFAPPPSATDNGVILFAADESAADAAREAVLDAAVEIAKRYPELRSSRRDEFERTGFLRQEGRIVVIWGTLPQPRSARTIYECVETPEEEES